jgi:PTH2 family peptidyl-tRNA hydrolase
MVKKMVVVVDKSLGMSAGKLGAQVGHGVLCAEKLADEAVVQEWYDKDMMRKIILETEGLMNLKQTYYQAVKKGLPAFAVVDAGLTEVPKGTMTCVAIGPCDSEDIDPITGGFALYSDSEKQEASKYVKVAGIFYAVLAIVSLIFSLFAVPDRFVEIAIFIAVVASFISGACFSR